MRMSDIPIPAKMVGVCDKSPMAEGGTNSVKAEPPRFRFLLRAEHALPWDTSLEREMRIALGRTGAILLASVMKPE